MIFLVCNLIMLLAVMIDIHSDTSVRKRGSQVLCRGFAVTVSFEMANKGLLLKLNRQYQTAPAVKDTRWNRIRLGQKIVYLNLLT